MTKLEALTKMTGNTTMTDAELVERLRSGLSDFDDWEEAADRIEQLTAELDGLTQTSAILCDDCGWAMSFPNFECVYCGFHRLEKERDRLRDALEYILAECTLSDNTMPSVGAIKYAALAALKGESK